MGHPRKGGVFVSRKRGKEHHEEHIDETWLIPYADLLTLLLALFIVLFAASNVDKEKFAAIAQAFNIEMGGSSAGILPPGGVGVNPNFPAHPPSASPSPSPTGENGIEGEFEEKELHDLQKLQIELEEYFKEENLHANVGMHIDERGLVISFNNSVLFDSGKADIRSEYVPLLTKMGVIIKRLNHHIRVEGHTDNLPIHSSRFPSNWELSVTRATTVVKIFIDNSSIEPEMLAAVGYGESRPVTVNDTVEGRAKNRRVDVILLNTKFDRLEMENKQSAIAQTP